MTSTGGPVSWWFAARAPGRTGCRCRPMSARRSPRTCGAGGRASDRREVFLRSKAPYEPIASGTVASTVRRACRRAGIAEFGSHRLRHTAACEMVQANVPLVRIGQVLRHRSLQSTAIYARVDVERLRLLAAPWPGGARAMSALQAHVDEYLRLRRALGFKLERDGRLLGQLVAYLEAAGASTVTTRAGDLVGATARRRAPEPVGEAAADRARVRRLPADDRPERPRSRRRTCSPSAVSAPPRTCSPSRTSVGCWRRRGGCATRCARRAMRRCSGCSPCPACGSARRSRSSATTSTSTPA